MSAPPIAFQRILQMERNDRLALKASGRSLGIRVLKLEQVENMCAITPKL